MTRLHAMSLLLPVLVACGTDVVEPSTVVTSSALTAGPACRQEQAARDAAFKILIACLNIQMEAYQRGGHHHCDVEQKKVDEAEAALRACLDAGLRPIDGGTRDAGAAGDPIPDGEGAPGGAHRE